MKTIPPPAERTQGLSYENPTNYNSWTVIQLDNSYPQTSTSLGPDLDPSSRYRYPRNLSEERHSSTNRYNGYTNFEPSCPPTSSMRKTSQLRPNEFSFHISPSAPSSFAHNNDEEEPPPSYYDVMNSQSYM